MYFAVHGGTGRGFFSEAGRGGCVFFPRRDGAVVFFFRGGTGWFVCFFPTGRDGAVWQIIQKLHEYNTYVCMNLESVTEVSCNPREKTV